MQQFEFPDGLLTCFWPLLQQLDSRKSLISTEALWLQMELSSKQKKICRQFGSVLHYSKKQESGANLIYNFQTICKLTNQTRTNHKGCRKNSVSCKKKKKKGCLFVPSEKDSGYGDVVTVKSWFFLCYKLLSCQKERRFDGIFVVFCISHISQAVTIRRSQEKKSPENMLA